jgi:hypothetical protein
MKREKTHQIYLRSKPERTLKILEKDGFTINDERLQKNIYKKRGK